MKHTRKYKILIILVPALLCASIYFYIVFTHWTHFGAYYIILDKETHGDHYYVTACLTSDYFEDNIDEDQIQCDQKQFDSLEEGNCYFLYTDYNHIRKKLVLSGIDIYSLWKEYVDEAFVKGSDYYGTIERGDELDLIISDSSFDYGDGVLRCITNDKLEYYNIVDGEIRDLSAADKNNLQDHQFASTDDAAESGYILSEAKIHYGVPAFAVTIPENGGDEARTYIVDHWTAYFDTFVGTKWFDDQTIGVMRKSSEDKYALYLISLNGEV